MKIEGSLEGWIMVLISSLSCILGASIVVLLGNSKIISSKKFLSASMALGGGVLIFNSLYTLLPASKQKLNSNFITYLCFFAGVLFTLFLTFIIQLCTPHALHSCDPISTIQSNTRDNIPKQNHYQHFHNHQQQHYHHPHHTHKQYSHTSSEYGSLAINKHNQKQNKSDYYLIGMQTAIAICIHKFPEGLIMFVSNQSSSQLGISVAAAMIIHNFIEGFLIALPLYYATNSRLSAFGYASFLGGMSQPLGAVLGLLVIRNVDPAKEQVLFGIIFGVVSGMMCLISVQSMLPQAIRADTSHQCVPLFFFFGIFLVGLSSLLQSM